MNSINVYTNNAASDADEVRSVYAFDMTSYEEIEEQYHGNEVSSDADEVLSVYAFESTSYGAEETTKADETLYRQDLTSFNLFNLYPPVGYKTAEHRNADVDVDDDAIESDNGDAFEKESVYAYEKPNATRPNDYHEHEGCFCGNPADYDLCDVEVSDDEESDSDADDDERLLLILRQSLEKAYAVRNIVETVEEAFEKESVYAYEKPNEKCPIDWHGHEGCHCGKPADYYEDVEDCNVDADGDDDAIDPCNVHGNDETCGDDVASESTKECNGKAVKNIGASCLDCIRKFVNDNMYIIEEIWYLIVLFYLASFWAKFGGFALKNRWHMAYVYAFVLQSNIVITLILYSLIKGYYQVIMAITFSKSTTATTKKTNHCGFQVNNHGTSVSYKMVAIDWTLEFINKKTTVYHDKSGSIITLHYSGSKVVSVTHDGTTYTSYETVPSKVADLFVAARCAVNQLWQ